jgi:hypothetical protein
MREAKKLMRGLHALQGHVPPHRHRPDAPWVQRLPKPHPFLRDFSGATSTSSNRIKARPACHARPCGPCNAARCSPWPRCWRWPRAAHGPSRGSRHARCCAYAFRTAETGFDPAKISDIYSRTVTPHIFEALYTYDHLARPAADQAAAGRRHARGVGRLPVWTVRLKPGIHFADDPAFKGKKRELVAPTTSTRSSASPIRRWKSPALELDRASASSAWPRLRKAAQAPKQPFDYDRRSKACVVDRYTLRFTLAEPRPRFVETSSPAATCFGPGARGGRALRRQDRRAPGGHRPVPAQAVAAQLADRAGAQPDYRDVFYDAQPAADDAEGQALLARFKGRAADGRRGARCRSSRRTSRAGCRFLNGSSTAARGQRCGARRVRAAGDAQRQAGAQPGQARHPGPAPHVARRQRADYYFNMEDPVVGGYTPDKVALRRAISLAYDATARSASCGAARPCRRRPGDAPAPPATTRPSRAR